MNLVAKSSCRQRAAGQLASVSFRCISKQRRIKAALKGPSGKSRDQSSGILHIVEDPQGYTKNTLTISES